MLSCENPECEVKLPKTSWSWLSLPASRHNGTCVVSLADGHVEVRKWMDARTKRPVTGKHTWLDRDAPGSPVESSARRG